MPRFTLEEADAFAGLAKLAGLRVRPGTIQRRQPPEADILCQLEDGSLRAFELTEIVTRGNLEFIATANDRYRAVRDAYEGLDERTHSAFRARFRNTPLSFYFLGTARPRVISATMPEILKELITMPEIDGAFTDFAAAQAPRIIESVRLEGRYESDDCNFNVGGFLNPTSTAVETIAAKLRRRYVSDHPIELLAYVGGFAWPEGIPVEAIRTLIDKQGLGQFTRVHVLAWKECVLSLP